MEKNEIPNWLWIILTMVVALIVLYLICREAKITTQKIHDLFLKKQEELARLLIEHEELKWKKKLIDRQANRIFFCLKIIFVFIIGCINIFMVLFKGADLINTVSNTFAIVSGLYCTTMFLISKKIFDVDVCQRILYFRIKIWLYKRNQFELSQILVVREMITSKKVELAELEKQIIKV